MQSLWKLTVLLCCAWAATLLYGELFSFSLPLFSCSWPSLTQTLDAQKPSPQVKVVVLADPQLTDRTSLRLAPKSFALKAVEFYTDLYMRRSFHSSMLPFKPDLILFLGDHFDGGPFLSDEEWHESLIRFKFIFGVSKQSRKANIKVHYLSGNHDIGYASFHALHPKVIKRYESEFGPRNYFFTVGKVVFIVVDAQTLDGPLQSDLTSTTWEFVKNVSKDVTISKSRVLLTHIPLFRPDGTPCGQYRSSPIINQRISHSHRDQRIMYQNYLTEETSKKLLELVRPILALSGHDHDQCTVIHTTSFGSVVEHTLGTLSWQQGNLYPSFMLLTANSIGSSNITDLKAAVSTNLCFLPMQTHIYIWYLSLFLVTVLLLLIWPANGLGSFHSYYRFFEIVGTMTTVFKAGPKEKDEDENCEYEMIWDAEGTMHLIKKAVKPPVVNSSNIGSSGRGNVVIRTTAKKKTAEVTEATTSAMEAHTEIKVDDSGKAPRPNKSKARVAVQRLFRVLRLLSVIAAVNMPLYMMLLLKDWVDL